MTCIHACNVDLISATRMDAVTKHSYLNRQNQKYLVMASLASSQHRLLHFPLHSHYAWAHRYKDRSILRSRVPRQTRVPAFARRLGVRRRGGGNPLLSRCPGGTQRDSVGNRRP